ncbi:hypothetical protein JYU34_011876 [Plutella xylostella]|uniref:Uncharacterized protein n=1 Tax=Plutella xylostella TaxID=51655 RepID=A0ABQ7QHG3_PLUXY|nr:hypothetical protein JYU34_011876 [Plutella xylostella]
MKDVAHITPYGGGQVDVGAGARGRAGGGEALLAAPAASVEISDARRPSYEIIAPS